MNSVLTTCGYCGCGCNFYAHTENNRIVGISPKQDHPVSRGMLCAKGWQGHEFVRHPDRLQFPLVRAADGTLHKASWDTAMQVTVDALKAFKSKPEQFALLSSARCTNEENYLAAKFTRAVMGSAHIDHCARL